MATKEQIVVLLATVVLLADARKIRKKATLYLPNEELCSIPPVEPRLDLAAYAGRWYSIFNSGDATRVAGNQCVTADYTLRKDGKIDVLNCQSPRVGRKPECIEGVAKQQEAFGKTSRLEVKFPFIPAGPYEVAALVGQKSYGYFAAAVFSCDALSNGGRVPSFFIIARTPYMPEATLSRLIQRLRNKGYSVSESDFIESVHPQKCKYQTGPGSFVIQAGPPMGIPMA